MAEGIDDLIAHRIIRHVHVYAGDLVPIGQLQLFSNAATVDKTIDAIKDKMGQHIIQNPLFKSFDHTRDQ